jgi:GNAT superfamily N-acetyltransferase
VQLVEVPRSESYYAAIIEERKTLGFIAGAITGGALLLIDMQVEKTLRRQGLGSRLYTALELWARLHGAQTLTGVFRPEPGWGDQATAFYTSKGILIGPAGNMFKKLG